MASEKIVPPFKVSEWGDILDSKNEPIILLLDRPFGYSAIQTRAFARELCAVMNKNATALCHAANGEGEADANFKEALKICEELGHELRAKADYCHNNNGDRTFEDWEKMDRFLIGIADAVESLGNYVGALSHYANGEGEASNGNEGGKR